MMFSELEICVLHTLRNRNGMTVYEICEPLGLNSVNGRDKVYKRLVSMAKWGFVRKNGIRIKPKHGNCTIWEITQSGMEAFDRNM